MRALRYAITGLVTGIIGLIAAAALLIWGLAVSDRCRDHIGHNPTQSELQQCIIDGV